MMRKLLSQLGCVRIDIILDGGNFMSGRLVILIMGAAAIIMSVFFYRTLTTSSQHKELATDQMKMEFRDYAATVKKVEKLPVAEQNNTQFYIDMKSDWNFLISDRTLVVTAPELYNEPGAKKTPNAETLEAARKVVHAFIFDWLVEKFHTQKDIQVEVRFQNEPQLQKN